MHFILSDTTEIPTERCTRTFYRPSELEYKGACSIFVYLVHLTYSSRCAFRLALDADDNSRSPGQLSTNAEYEDYESAQHTILMNITSHRTLC